MLDNPMDVLRLFPVRKSKQQKQAFRDAVQEYARQLGYECSAEKGSMGSRNVIIGDPEKAKYLVTAHYDTPARVLIPNWIVPCNACFYIGSCILYLLLFILLSCLFGLPVFLLTSNLKVYIVFVCVVFFALFVLSRFGPAQQMNDHNSSGAVTLLEIARTMPEIHREKVCYVLFDFGEIGKTGSAEYYKKYKKYANNQIVLNLDCVGDGDEIIFFPSKKLKKNQLAMNSLKHIGGWFGEKHISVREKGFSVYPSDQKNFPLGVGIAAFHNSKFAGPYCSRIHTKKDTVLDETNVNLLRAALTTLISCGGESK